MAHFLVGTVVGPVDRTLIIIPEGGGECNLWHVEISKEVMDKLCNFGTFVSRFDFRFAGTTADPRFANDMPSQWATSTSTNGAKERATFSESDEVTGVRFRGVLGAPVSIGIGGEERIILGPTVGSGEVGGCRLGGEGNTMVKGPRKVA